MQISARNIIKGKIKENITGDVNSEVIIIPGTAETIVPIIIKDSVESLGLKVGKDVLAVIKASNAMVMMDKLTCHPKSDG